MISKLHVAILGTTLCMCAHAGTSLEELDSLTATTEAPKAAIPPVRMMKLRDAATALGFKAGASDRAEKLIKGLEARAYKYDQMYRFGALITKNGVLPPVITEARDAIQAGDDQVRVADRVYKIVSKAKFARTNPPTWRQYLFVGLTVYKDIPKPSSGSLPTTPDEIAYWKEQIKQAWTEGEKYSDEVLEKNFARLDRDYLGILRYSELLNKGMVSEPVVAIASSVVTGGKNEISVGDTLFRVTDPGGFITDAKKWQPVVSEPAGASAATAPAPSISQGGTGAK